jgi:alpha-L-rhamnosidase
MSDDLSRQFQERYLNMDSHSGVHTLTGYTLALRWGLIPDDSRTDVGNQLAHRIDQNRGPIPMGNLSRSQLLFALSDTGQSDAAYQLLSDKSFEDPWAAQWLYENAAGISPVAFGFTHIQIAPHISNNLQSAGAIYDSTVGRIVCKWKRTDHGVSLSINVPINCTAELDIPDANDAQTVRESGESADVAPGVKIIGNQKDIKVFELQSGNYEFSVMQ